MSLYAFGKIVGYDVRSLKESLVQIAQVSGVVFAVDSLDEEDRASLESEKPLDGAGIAYSLQSNAAERDATRLWIMAQKALNEQSGVVDSDPIVSRFLRTTFGRVCADVLALGETSSLALIDGGIETTFSGEIQRCLEAIALDIQRPWDQCANCLYIRINDVAK